jgi:hypothetical protein
MWRPVAQGRDRATLGTLAWPMKSSSFSSCCSSPRQGCGGESEAGRRGRQRRREVVMAGVMGSSGGVR